MGALICDANKVDKLVEEDLLRLGPKVNWA